MSNEWKLMKKKWQPGVKKKRKQDKHSPAEEKINKQSRTETVGPEKSGMHPKSTFSFEKLKKK